MKLHLTNCELKLVEYDTQIPINTEFLNQSVGLKVHFSVQNGSENTDYQCELPFFSHLHGTDANEAKGLIGENFKSSKEIHFNKLSWNKPFFNLFQIPTDLPGPVLFLVEMILLELIKHHHPLAFKDSFDFNRNILIASLGLSPGFSICKLKIRPYNQQECLDIINTHSGITFRLDANQTLEYREWKDFFSKLKHKNIEYIEDPLKPEEGLVSSYDWPYPLAYDGISNDPIYQYLILKPSVLGISCVFNQALKAFWALNNQKRNIILSSTFEGPSTYWKVASLCFFHLFRSDLAQGLGTMTYMDVGTHPVFYLQGDQLKARHEAL